MYFESTSPVKPDLPPAAKWLWLQVMSEEPEQELWDFVPTVMRMGFLPAEPDAMWEFARWASAMQRAQWSYLKLKKESANKKAV